MGVIGRLARLAVPLSFFGTAVGCTVLVKDYYSGARYSGQARIDGKTVIITGANTGIGKETAKDLAARGGRVILACRDTNKGEQAAEEIRQSTDNKNVFVRQLDLSSLQSVRTFADNVVKASIFGIGKAFGYLVA
ncbi:retinol dehydrogenase 13-like [Saccoglossus kowalevskii]|uniref:Retinol dehydrogenase 13-like n=1 Tax=Saccoglossus kowalevskii TaxID=10224 RepID=A0ABM0LZK2_SACKO|nr:PREDICTED: retinol dehydrogenase 13-like [Saccoglossus kowalevskii]